jgi:hypothetical protein
LSIGVGNGLSSHGAARWAFVASAILGVGLIVAGIAKTGFERRQQQLVVADVNLRRDSHTLKRLIIDWYRPNRQMSWRRRALGRFLGAAALFAVGVVVLIGGMIGDEHGLHTPTENGVRASVPVIEISYVGRNGQPQDVVVQLPRETGSKRVSVDLSSSRLTDVHVGGWIVVRYDPKKPTTVAADDVVRQRLSIKYEWNFIAFGSAVIVVGLVLAGFGVAVVRRKY